MVSFFIACLYLKLIIMLVDLNKYTIKLLCDEASQSIEG